MINLLQETIRALRAADKTIDNVLWIGNSQNSWSWEDFSKIADFEYDNGFGYIYIPEDLVVVGKDWWLERYNYEGAEHWEFKERPTRYCTNEHFVLKIEDLNNFVGL